MDRDNKQLSHRIPIHLMSCLFQAVSDRSDDAVVVIGGTRGLKTWGPGATMVCEIENIFQDGDCAILEWKDPTGLRGCGFFNVVDDKIVFQRGYFNELSFLRLQGLPLPTK